MPGFPCWLCIIGAVMILMARQRVDENVQKSNSVIGMILLVMLTTHFL
jgi:hypothetical protein